jgi:ABC-type oligopeptide transport system substrate-binding subunit
MIFWSRRLWGVWVPVLALITLGVACTRPGDPASAPSGKSALKPLSVQLASEPASLDPTLAEDGISLLVLGNTMDGLFGYDGDGKLQKALAESYSVSPNGLRYEFALKAGASWSDGRPVAIADFVTAFRRALTATQGARLAGMLFRIRGAKEHYTGKGATSVPLAVRDEGGKLVIELTEPTPYFLHVLSLPVALPLRQDVLDANRGRWPELAPSTGPYRIAGRVADRVIRLARNESYRTEPAGFPEVELLIVNDEAASLNLFEQSRIDVLTRVESGLMPRLRRLPGALRSSPFLATYYLSFNFKKPPFDDRLWRQAVSGSIDREELVRALDGGDGPARGWVPPGLEGSIAYSDPRPGLKDSVAEALAKTAQKPMGPLGAVFDTSARNRLVMEKVQADLKASLGMRISLNNLDWKSYLKAVQTDPPSLFRLGILTPIADPIQMLEAFTSASPFNYLKWSNAEYDRLVERIAGLKPGAEREAKIREAQSILVDREAVIVPLYHYAQNHAVGPRVDGFKANPFGVIRFADLRASGAAPLTAPTAFPSAGATKGDR